MVASNSLWLAILPVLQLTVHITNAAYIAQNRGFDLSGSPELVERQHDVTRDQASAAVLDVFQRDTTQCGKNSAGGSVKCGMNICCSAAGWCGTTDAHCIGDASSPCQTGFGSCATIRAKNCSASANSAGGRTIGYYQGNNFRNRRCESVTPSQIITTGYTHLYYAFASIDPATFKVTYFEQADVATYTQFTALKTSKLQTWIAIGGFDFSNPGPTRTTWSDLVASSAHRATFIASLQTFMTTYGFQGVDIDWESPVAADRGGNAADTANLVTLLKEMRAAFGTTFGISIVLPPDYGYLQYFDAISMQPYVNWFGFMSYDLHTASTSEPDQLVHGQSDIRDIDNMALPLWYDGLDPAKINFGIAWYGRGYTLSSTSCKTIGCPWSGPSKAGQCTNSPGLLSLMEIKDTIKSVGVQPTLNQNMLMKELTWADQWIGYDDDDTFALKRSAASAHCYGGTMAWSVDFYGGGTTSAPAVSKDGTCGSQNGGTICAGSGFGSCCSSSGWCGDTAAYCSGANCQSGACTVSNVTTDGTCGAAHGGTVCGSWSNGKCCSSAGWCGSTSDYCGAGCQSGCT